MLNAFRDNLKSLKWVLWLTAAAMTLYLGQYFIDGGSGPQGNWAARVDGREVSLADFRQRAQSMDQQYRNQFGAAYDQLKGSIKLGTQAAETLIDRELILADARRQGIAAAPEEISEILLEIPSLQGADGKFVGMEAYRTQFGNFPGGIKGFEKALADDVVINKWQNMIAESVTVSDEELRRTFRDRNETTGIDYFIVPTSEVSDSADVTESDLQAWYDANSDKYRRGLGRKIRYATLERNRVSDSIEISDSDVLGYYNANQANYQRPEQREARHILIKTEPGGDSASKQAAHDKAEQLMTRVRAGESFETLARTHSDDPVSGERGGDLGYFGRGAMVEAFDKVAFDTPLGQLAPLTETQFGFHIIEVTGERPAGPIPMAEVEEDIRRTLRLTRAEERIEEEVGRVRGLISSPAKFDEVAAAEALKTGEVFVTEGMRIPELGTGPGFAVVVFDTPVGKVGDPQDAGAGKVIFVVDAEVPPGVAPLDEVRDRVRGDLVQDRARKAAVARAETAMASADSLAGAASNLNSEVQSSGSLTRVQDIPGSGGLGAEAKEILFSDSAFLGDRGVVEVPSGALVYEITSREPFDENRFLDASAQLETELVSRRQNEMVDSVLSRLRDAAEIERNQAIIAQIDSVNG